MGLELIIMTPDHQTRRIPLDRDAVAVGRAHDNDLSFPEDASLSRRHLKLSRDEDGWWVEDLGSKNGTMVNEARVKERHRLYPGDRVTAGHLGLTIFDPEAGVRDDVVFVAESGAEMTPEATVMTSLEGLLSGGENTIPPQKPSAAAPAPRPVRAFDTPEVRALVRAGRELVVDRPLEELFPLILDLSIEAVGAERGVVLTLEEDRLEPRAVHGDGFRISTTVRDRVIDQKNSILVRNLAHDKSFREQASIFEQQIHTMMAVPLQTENRVIGLIYVDSRSFVREFTEDDLNLLTVLANVAANRIEHQRLGEVARVERERRRELEKAAVIQRTFLPSGAPRLQGLELAGHNAASRTVGGDYYDFIPYDDRRVAVVLGDVAGKGMEAALMMTNLQARVQILAEEPRDLGRLMTRLDQSVSAHCPSNRFITLFFALIDAAGDELKYCSAGHNPSFLVRADGSVESLPSGGTVLGILPELGYEEKSLRFAPGDLLAIYSDGVTEAESTEGEEFGEQRLTEVLSSFRTSSAEKIVGEVLAAVDRWTGGAPPADDVTVVVARRTE